MFQSTRSSADQERVNQEQQQRARDATTETQQRVESQLEHRTADVQRQTIEGKAQELQVTERAGATKQDVVNQVHGTIMGSVDFELSRLKAPSFNADRRAEYRDNAERKIQETAEQILAKQEETFAQQAEAERKLMQQERKAQIVEQETKRATNYAMLDLGTESFATTRK
jgi:hypothetical protein